MTDPAVPCPRCRHENSARARFCLECGQRLALVCAGCGAEVPDAAKFCMECGRSVGAPVAAPAAGPAGTTPETRTPAAYTPRHLAEKIQDGVAYHTYSTYARGLDGLSGMYHWLDRAPRGRNETDVWWRRHDEYATH